MDPDDIADFSKNAEIDLEAIKDHRSAKRWLMGTFLYVRVKRNPGKYGPTDSLKQGAIEDSLYNICAKDIALLKEWNLITTEAEFKSTEFGDAMARYYIRFETMKKFLTLKRASKLSDIVSLLPSVYTSPSAKDISYLHSHKLQSFKSFASVQERKLSIRN